LGQLGQRHPAGRPRRLEVLGVHEVHAVVEVHLELPAAEALAEKALGIAEEGAHGVAPKAGEALEANRAHPGLLDEDRAGEVRPHSPQLGQGLLRGRLRVATPLEGPIHVILEQDPRPRGQEAIHPGYYMSSFVIPAGWRTGCARYHGLMAQNTELAACFEEMADHLELREESPFRIRAYRRAAQQVLSLGEDAGLVLEARRKIPGIGADLAAKIREYAATGAMADLEAMRQSLPARLPHLMAVPPAAPPTPKLLFST